MFGRETEANAVRMCAISGVENCSFWRIILLTSWRVDKCAQQTAQQNRFGAAATGCTPFCRPVRECVKCLTGAPERGGGGGGMYTSDTPRALKMSSTRCLTLNIIRHIPMLTTHMISLSVVSIALRALVNVIKIMSFRWVRSYAHISRIILQCPSFPCGNIWRSFVRHMQHSIFPTATAINCVHVCLSLPLCDRQTMHDFVSFHSFVIEINRSFRRLLITRQPPRRVLPSKGCQACKTICPRLFCRSVDYFARNI